MSPGVSTLHEFTAAVDAFPGADELPMEWAAGARRCAQRSLRRHGLCLVGEIHGVAENPLVIERLVEELGIDVVALEWPKGLERAIDDLRLLDPSPSGPRHGTKSPDETALAGGVAWVGDGRVTAGHFAVLRRIRAHMAAVDEPNGPPTADERDAAMARNVEQLLRSDSGTVLFVAGNLHTRLREHAYYQPAGMHLARERPGLCALDVHYDHGRFWNGGSRTLQPTKPPSGPHLSLAEATEAVVLTAAPAGYLAAASPAAASPAAASPAAANPDGRSAPTARDH